MAALRRGILFILGIVCLLGAILEDPVHLTSLFSGLMLMGVITWDQLASTVRRYDDQERLGHDDER
jgi:hypothetical protein